MVDCLYVEQVNTDELDARHPILKVGRRRHRFPVSPPSCRLLVCFSECSWRWFCGVTEMTSFTIGHTQRRYSYTLRLVGILLEKLKIRRHIVGIIRDLAHQSSGRLCRWLLTCTRGKPEASPHNPP